MGADVTTNRWYTTRERVKDAAQVRIPSRNLLRSRAMMRGRMQVTFYVTP